MLSLSRDRLKITSVDPFAIVSYRMSRRLGQAMLGSGQRYRKRHLNAVSWPPANFYDAFLCSLTLLPPLSRMVLSVRRTFCPLYSIESAEDPQWSEARVTSSNELSIHSGELQKLHSKFLRLHFEPWFNTHDVMPSGARHKPHNLTSLNLGLPH